ncbi:MAG: rhodanese-like domain-containing protein [Proteobacteria bacterium]|jgi:rhodanese-related sulfurtransferase|nr:rhodanese-like domain-containing protein [Pseudomonadota bacterium]
MHWNIKEIEAHELANRLTADDRLRIIDVREMREIVAGTIPGAEAMPMASIPVRLHELERDKDLVFICRSGARSAQVCMFLQQQGFDNVINLRHGMMGWAGSGQQVSLPEAV